MKIFINGREKETTASVLSYEQLVVVAEKPKGSHPTVVWQRPGGLAGSLVSNQQISLEEGMHFDIVFTNQA